MLHPEGLEGTARRSNSREHRLRPAKLYVFSPSINTVIIWLDY